jgi:integrase
VSTFKRWKGRIIKSQHPNYKQARWWYSFRLRNKRYTGSLPEARSKQDADDAERTIIGALHKNRYGGQSKDVSFSVYVDQTFLPWSVENKASSRDDHSRAKELKAFYRDTPIQAIRTTDCRRLKRHLSRGKTPRGTPRKDATVNRYMDLLSAIFTRAIEDELRDSNPCTRIKKESEGGGRERSLTGDEYDCLLAAAVDDLAYMRAAIVFALGTGLRRGEMLKLKIECVNLSDTIAHVLAMDRTIKIPPDCLVVPERKHSKNKYTRVVPLNKNTRAVLSELIGDRPGGEFVFTKDANGVDDYWLKAGFKRACERGEITQGLFKAGGVSWHDLRRTFATQLREHNVHAYDIKYLLGHAIDKGETARYARESLPSLRRAIETLNEPWGSVILFQRGVG